MTYSAKANPFLLFAAAMLLILSACGGSGDSDGPDGDTNVCEPGLDFDEGMQACVCVADGCCYEDADCLPGQVCNSAHRCLGDIPDEEGYIPGDEDGDEDGVENDDSGEGEGEGDSEGEGDGDIESDGDTDGDGSVDGDVELGTQLQPYYGVEALDVLERMPEFLPLASSEQFSSSNQNDNNSDYLGSNLYMDGTEQVLLDSKRPGCIYRMQFNQDDANSIPERVLNFYFDNEESPRIGTKIKLMFQGGNAPFLAPLVGIHYLVGETKYGYYSYIPICWQERLKVTSNGPMAGYNIQYHNFASDIGIESYDDSLDLSDAIDYYTYYAVGGEGKGQDPKPDNGGNSTVITPQSTSPVGAGATFTLATIRNQAGSIDSLRLKPSPNEDEDIMTNAWLQITWDNKAQADVYAPLGMFFGRGFYGSVGDFSWYSLPVGMDSDGWMYCHFPMPFTKSADIKLINNSSTDIIDLQYEITWTANSYPRGVGIFSAVYNESAPVQSGQDYVALETFGRGKYVGTVLAMAPVDGSYTRNFLDGDERIYVDEMSSPSIIGTGTGEFFNFGKLFGGEMFETPLFGAWKDTETHQYMARRFQLSDTIPFNYSIKVGFEHGGTNDVEADYKSVSYYYLSCLGGMVQSDHIMVLDSGNEVDHDFASGGSTGTVQYLAATYMGDNDTSIGLSGRTISQSGGSPGYFLFTMGASESSRLNPMNIGVRLKRTLDRNVGNQDAKVYVRENETEDSAYLYVGNWYTPGRNTANRWLDSIFDIPGEFTSGKESLTVKIEYEGGENWNMFGELIAYSFLPLVTDSTGPGSVPLSSISYEMYGMQPRLSWSPPTSGTPAAVYHIYRSLLQNYEPSDDTLVGSTTQLTFLDPETLEPNTEYFYKLVAEDCTGVRGQPSQSYSVQTGQPSLCIDLKLANVAAGTTGSITPVMEQYAGFGFANNDALYFPAVSDSSAQILVIQGTEEQTVNASATYDVTVTYLRDTDLGKWQLSINSSSIGAIQDSYSALAEAVEVDLGTVSIDIEEGQPTFVFRIRGKNAASIGYGFVIDEICLK